MRVPSDAELDAIGLTVAELRGEDPWRWCVVGALGTVLARYETEAEAHAHTCREVGRLLRAAPPREAWEDEES